LALRLLCKDPRIKPIVRRAPREVARPDAGVLRIEPASYVRSSLTLLWGGSLSHSGTTSQSLDYSVLAAEGAWLRAAAPLPAFFRLGTPDPARKWVLVANEVAADRKSIEALTGLRPVQLQRIAEPIIVRK